MDLELVSQQVLDDEWHSDLKNTATVVLTCAFIFKNWYSGGGVQLGPLGTAVITDLLYQPRMIGDGDCGEIGGMKIDRGNRIPHD
jgi:hypothetical protein